MAEEWRLLTQEGQFKCKTSSTLAPASLYSSKNMFDNNHDTCWNSDQGTSQSITFDFQKSVVPQSIKFVFQGGFVGQEGYVETGDQFDKLAKLCDIHTLSDNNDLQTISLDNTVNNTSGRYLRITFPSSTDFYGRITIYSLEIWGK
eukprot:gene12033-13147_t